MLKSENKKRYFLEEKINKNILI